MSPPAVGARPRAENLDLPLDRKRTVRTGERQGAPRRGGYPLTEGQKHRGSQRWLQVAVNRCPDIIDGAVADAIGLASGETIEWVSPLESDAFREYRDQEVPGPARGSSKLATSRRVLAPRRTVVGRAGQDQRGALRAESQHTGVQQRSFPRLPGIAPQDTGGVRGDEGISAGQVGHRLVQALLPVRQPDHPPPSPRRCAEGRRAAAGHRQSWAGGHGDSGMDAPHAGGNHAGGPVPPGYGAPGQQHMAPPTVSGSGAKTRGHRMS